MLIPRYSYTVFAVVAQLAGAICDFAGQFDHLAKGFDRFVTPSQTEQVRKNLADLVGVPSLDSLPQSFCVILSLIKEGDFVFQLLLE